MIACITKEFAPDVAKLINLEDIVGNNEDNIKYLISERYKSVDLSRDLFMESRSDNDQVRINANDDLNFLYDHVLGYWAKNYAKNSVDVSLKPYFTYADDNGIEQFDLISYLEFKKYATSKVSNSIIINGNSVCHTDVELNKSLNSMKSNAVRNTALPSLNEITNEFKRKIKSSPDKKMYFDFIIKTNFVDVVEIFSNGTISYNRINGKFFRSDKKHHVAGWQRKDNRTAYDDSSGALKMLVEGTPLINMNNETVNHYAEYSNSEYNLTMPMFYSAISDFIYNHLLDRSRTDLNEEFLEVIKDPIKIIEKVEYYLQNSISKSLTYRTLASLWKKFFTVDNEYKGGDRINFSIAYSKIYSKAIPNDMVDYMRILLNSFIAYSSQDYIYYNEKIKDGNRAINTYTVGSKGDAIFCMRLATSLNAAMNDEANKDKNFDKLNSSSLLNLFNSYTGITDDNIKLIRELLKAAQENELDQFSNKIIEYANYYLSKHPGIISSMISRVDGGKVPTFRLRNGYSSFFIQMANLKNRGENSFITKTLLYNNPTLYIDTIYKLHYAKDNGGKIAIEMNEDEQAMLWVEDVRYGKAQKRLIFEPITPSDKPNPGYTVFDLDKKVGSKKLSEYTWEEARKLALSNESMFRDQYINAIEDLAEVLDIDISGISYEEAINIIDKKLESFGNANKALETINRLSNGSKNIYNIYHVKPVNKKLRFNRLLFGQQYDYANQIDDIVKYDIIRLCKLYNIGVNENWSLIKIINDKTIQEAIANATKLDISDFLTHLYLRSLFKDQYLAIMVGDKAAHKYSDNSIYDLDLVNGDFDFTAFKQARSESYKTMTKRMVALSATGHAVSKNILNGLPETLNEITISDANIPVIDINNEENSMNVWDGQVFAPMPSLWMHDNSTTDYKVSGEVRKTIHQESFNGVGYLRKESTLGLSNRYIRSNAGKFKFKRLLQVSYSKGEFRYNDKYVDITRGFNEKKIKLWGQYKDINGNINTVEIVENIPINNEVTNIYRVKINGNITEVELNNLWDIYNFFGAEWSGEWNDDKEFVFSELSNHIVMKLINNIGVKLNDSDQILSQLDVDQFLKKTIIHYFPTESTHKSVQLPISSNNIAKQDEVEYFISKIPSDNLMTQLDADHEIEDAELSAPTQMMSFMTQKGLVRDLTSDLYNALAKQINMASQRMKNGDPSEWRNIFGKDLIESFTRENVDILGLGNALMSEFNRIIKQNPGVSIDDLGIKIPFSDNNIHNKFASDVIVHVNKFIKHKFSGSADVMISTYDIYGLYEDLDGNKYNLQDVRFNPEIRELLESQDGSVQISAHEVEVETPYYLQDWNGNYYDFDDSNKLVMIPEKRAAIVKNYNQFIELLKEHFIISKSTITARNLKPKQVLLDVVIEYIDEDGELIEVTKTVNINSLYYQYIIRSKDNGVKLSKNDVESLKTRANNVLYTSIQKVVNNSGDKESLINDINKFGGILLFSSGKYISSTIKDILSIRQKEPEIIATNRMQSAYNIKPGDSINTILSIGPNYFIKNNIFTTPFDYDKLYINSDGNYIKPTLGLKKKDGSNVLIFTEFANDITGSLVKGFNRIDVPLDETGAYRVDKDGETLYSVDGLDFYEYKDQEVIVLRAINTIRANELLDKLLSSGEFAYFKPIVYEDQGEKYEILNPSIFEFLNSNPNVELYSNKAIERLGYEQYESFKLSLKYICARIPSQSNQFATPCDIVDFIESPYNMIGVNHYLTYEQGSDYDIDKSNNVGFSFDKNGVINKWSPFWDYSLLEECLKLPIPSGSQYIVEGNYASTTETEYALDVSNIIYGIISGIYNISDKRFIIDFISKYANKAIYYSADTVDELQLAMWDNAFNSLVLLINRHNSYKIKSKNDLNKAYDNKMVWAIRESYNDLSTYGYARWMTTTKFIKDSVSRSPKGSLMLFGDSVFDTITMNNNCSSAKKVVGNAASAIKANYSIEYAISMTMPEIAVKDLKVKTRTGIVEFNTKPSEAKNYENSKVAIYLSTLCTQATDNAKDPVLYYINCTPETSGAYTWLYLVGLNSDQAVDIMTTPLMDALMLYCGGNIILGKGKSQFVNVLKSLVDYSDPKKNIKKKDEDIVKLKKHLDSLGYSFSDYDAYYTIFKGASELRFLAGALSINQGMKNVYGEILQNNNRFEKNVEDSLKEIDNLKDNPYAIDFIDENGNIVFSKGRYYNDSIYRNIVIMLLDKVSVSFNPLRIINMSPHFSAMDELIPKTIKVLSSLSSKYNLLHEHITKNRHLEKVDGGYLSFTGDSSNMIRILGEVINTDMLAKFLHSINFQYTFLDDNDIEQTYSLSTATGVKEFVNFMNQVIFPILQNKYTSNRFIETLTQDSIYLADQKKHLYGYQLSKDLNAKENSDYLLAIMMDFNSIINDSITIKDIRDYSDIKFKNFEEHNIGDYLFLYNLFVFKNKLNGKSFSKLFNDSAFRMPLIKRYFDFVGLYDFDVSGANDNYTVATDIKQLYEVKYYNNKNSDFGESENDWGDDYETDWKSGRTFTNNPIDNTFFRQIMSKLDSELYERNFLRVSSLITGDILITNC